MSASSWLQLSILFKFCSFFVITRSSLIQKVDGFTINLSANNWKSLFCSSYFSKYFQNLLVKVFWDELLFSYHFCGSFEFVTLSYDIFKRQKQSLYVVRHWLFQMLFFKLHPVISNCFCTFWSIHTNKSCSIYHFYIEFWWLYRWFFNFVQTLEKVWLGCTFS